MIGLVDFSLQQSTSTSMLIPNLEIMKLATYYRTEEKQYCRLIGLDETELDGYDKIFFFSEHHSQNVPPAFLSSKNVAFGGTAFTRKTYIPFENPLIDFTLPRPALYKEFLQEKYNDGIKAKVIEHVMDDTYYRMYAGNELLPLPPIQTRQRVIIYDRDIFYPDWQQIVERILRRNPSKIICIHPIICKTLTQYFTLRSYDKISRKNDVILDIKVPANEIYYLFKEYQNQFLADIVNNSTVYLSLQGSYSSRAQYSQELFYKMHLLYSFWSRNIPIKLYYIAPDIGVHNPYEHLFQLICTWATNVMVASDTAKNKPLLDRIIANKGQKIENKEYEDLKRYCPHIEQLTKYNYQQIITGGVWRL